MANNILSRVQILMDANTASYEQNIRNAGQESTKSFGSIREEAGKMAKVVGAAAVTAGIAVGAMAINAAQTALEVDKMAKSAGVSTQSLMALRQAGRAFGIETESVAGAVSDLNEKIFEAAAGNVDSANAFAALGVSVTDTKGNIRAAGDVMGDIADKFASMSDGATKTAIAARLGGDGLKELIPVLNGGSAGLDAAEISAKRLGNTLSDETIAQVKILQADVGLVTNSVEGFGNQLLTGLAPTLVHISGGLKDATSDVRGMATAVGTLNELLKIIASAGALAAGAVKQVSATSEKNTSSLLLTGYALATGKFDTARKLLKDQVSQAFFITDTSEADKSVAWVKDLYDTKSAAADAAIAKEKEATAALQAEKIRIANETQRKIAALDNAESSTGVDKVKKAADDAQKAAESLGQAYIQQQSTLQKTIDMAGKSSNFASVSYELTVGSLAKLLPLQKQNLENLAKEADFALLRVQFAAERSDLDRQIEVLGKRVGLERTLFELETGKYKDFLPAQREELLNRQKHLLVTQNYQSLLPSIQTEEEKRASTLRDQLTTLQEARKLGVIKSDAAYSANVQSTLASNVKLPDFGGIDATVAGPQGELNKANQAGSDLDTAFDSALNSRRKLMAEGLLAESDYNSQSLALQEEYAKKRKGVDESIATAQSAIGSQNLANASATMGSLMDITAAFAGKNSATYRAMFLAQKAIGIATSIVAIQTAMAQASWSLPFPGNLGAMAIVAAQTASIVSTIASVAMPEGIAHGGLDNVPKEATYLLDQGERVLSPRQNKDFTQMMESDKRLKSGGGSGITVNIENYGSDKAFDVQQLDENTVRIIARDEISRDGGAVAAQALSNPNSSMSKAMSRNTSTQRNRG